MPIATASTEMSSNSSNQNLTVLLQRLESVTGRLEQLVVGGGQPSGQSAGQSADAAKQSAADSPSAVPPAVAAFDQLLAGPVAEWLRLSGQVGGLVGEQVLFMIRPCAMIAPNGISLLFTIIYATLSLLLTQ